MPHKGEQSYSAFLGRGTRTTWKPDKVAKTRNARARHKSYRTVPPTEPDAGASAGDRARAARSKGWRPRATTLAAKRLFFGRGPRAGESGVDLRVGPICLCGATANFPKRLVGIVKELPERLGRLAAGTADVLQDSGRAGQSGNHG